MNLSDFREDYRRGALDRAALAPDPIAQFESWFRAAAGEASQSPRWTDTASLPRARCC
jgi:pyridoxine/pyridoxamine 5'-phosphate oxidase